MTVASNSRYQKLAIHKARFEAVFLFFGRFFFGGKAGLFWMIGLRFLGKGKFRLTIDSKDMILIRYFGLYSSAGRSHVIFARWDTHFSVTPNFFSNSKLDLLNPMDEPLQRDWDIQIFLFEDQWEQKICGPKKTLHEASACAWWIRPVVFPVDDWAKLGNRIWKTFNLPKHFSFWDILIIINRYSGILPSLKLAVRTWKWMIGRQAFPIGVKGLFSEAKCYTPEN